MKKRDEDERAQVAAAHARIAPFIVRTPCISLRSGSLGTSGRLTLKLEQLQVTGSFKPRGVFNRLLGRSLPESGIVCASGGNHGAAMAYAAQRFGVRCEVFVPRIISTAKKDRLRRYGAHVVEYGNVYAEALQASEERAESTGAFSVHAFDHIDTLAGQGTVAKEVEEDIGVPDAIIAAVGGGGLIGGISRWFGRATHVIGAEPENCPTLHAALNAGAPEIVPTGGVAADALGCRQLGKISFEILERNGVSSVLVSDEAIIKAQRLLWEELRLLVEPAAAVPLAAARELNLGRDARVCLVVCGANLALDSL